MLNLKTTNVKPADTEQENCGSLQFSFTSCEITCNIVCVCVCVCVHACACEGANYHNPRHLTCAYWTRHMSWLRRLASLPRAAPRARLQRVRAEPFEGLCLSGLPEGPDRKQQTPGLSEKVSVSISGKFIMKSLRLKRFTEQDSWGLAYLPPELSTKVIF